ncbi:FAD/NAD(P)-binding domain-containing protein [Aspergillus steynii IBT 23096]|uniref:FAD/NAD(P)-binding domain-containing protein n=1 Tax=Aspergillus steynii IBT 23096 TaxID=1392250 RepID=A0A2I2GEY0_9EURO|nr:FAD/NAD(P)-binding domain-containing protein [Aspergillus steynii IBT 23096]PLB51436.1 FAD/NAD(P)-binding domain-containing protein [Aspergillus steynii IBT 23096]
MGSIETPAFDDLNRDLECDVLIIGAGLSGIYSIYQMRQLGLRAKVLEAGGDVGGTWYWNRYPGARFDSESYSYGFSFSQEILEEWDWSEHFAAQPETLRYCEFVCDKFDLRKDMQFNTQITAAHFQEDSRSWLLTDEAGKTYTSRFLVTAMGILNNFTLPNIPGVRDFRGPAYHTARWPHESIDFRGKRVAVIGTGATGIQAIQEIAKTVGHLTVFQRTPNWSAPLNNSRISSEEMAQIRTKYPEIFQKCRESYSGFIHVSDKRRTLDVDPETREALWNDLYETRGFGKWLGNFGDINTNRKANALFSEFMANKIRQRVHDPKTAELLIPKCHGFGTKRVPLESGYFEVYNQPNVRLVDSKTNPIQRITAEGIQTQDEDFTFDMIIYATGFDAVTGSFTAIDFQGRNQVKLADQWRDGPRTFLGMFAEHFPNMMMVMGPHQMFGNFPRSIEYSSRWVASFIRYARDNRITCAECTHEGVAAWTEHVHECAEGLLSNEVDSWMSGVNKNLAHKQKRIVARYNGPAPGYRKRADAVAAREYQDLVLS